MNATACKLCAWEAAGYPHPDGGDLCRSCFRDLCPQCGKPGAEEHYDRHGIYSGRACGKCARDLPGQGASWHYEADEPIEADGGS